MLRALVLFAFAAPAAVVAQSADSDACNNGNFCPQAVVDAGTGPWNPVAPADVGDVCRLDYDALRQVTPPEGATFAVVRYGQLCFVSGDDPSVGDQVNHVFSATKTLGAALTGMVMYQTRDLPVSEDFGKGPLREFDRADHWIDLSSLGERGDIHPEATLAHILSMEAYNDSLAYGEKQHRYDAAGSREINFLIQAIDRAVAQDTARFGADAKAARDRLFTKLGMEHSDWAVEVFGYSWNASLKDMSRLGLLINNGGVYNGERLIDADFAYNMVHPAFEDGSTRYGYLTWVSPLDCAPQAIHRTFPHGLSEAQSCLLESGCEQQHDVGVWSANGARGQFIIGHRGLDLVLVGQNWNSVSASPLWNAVRPAVVAADPVYRGDEEAFCAAYSSGDYAPDLKLWEGDL